jgi:hypothetical protein
VLGEFDLFHEGSGGGAAISAMLPTAERTLLREHIKDILSTFQPLINADGTRVGKFETLCAQLLSIGKLLPAAAAAVGGEQADGVSPDEANASSSTSKVAAAAPFLVVELLLQCIVALPQAPHLTAYVHRTLLELARFAPTEVRAASYLLLICILEWYPLLVLSVIASTAALSTE